MHKLAVQLKSPSLWLKAVRSLRGFGQLARYMKTNVNDTWFFAAFLGGRKLVGPHLMEVLYACCEVFLGVLDSAVRYSD